MTLREKIQVMEAFERGEEIEQVERLYDNWYNSPFPRWDWNAFLYHIKPKPKQIVTIEKWLCASGFNMVYYTVEGTKEYFDRYTKDRVKLIDTYEVEL